MSGGAGTRLSVGPTGDEVPLRFGVDGGLESCLIHTSIASFESLPVEEGEQGVSADVSGELISGRFNGGVVAGAKATNSDGFTMVPNKRI